MRAQANYFQVSVSSCFPCQKSCQLSHDELPLCLLRTAEDVLKAEASLLSYVLRDVLRIA